MRTGAAQKTTCWCLVCAYSCQALAPGIRIQHKILKDFTHKEKAPLSSVNHSVNRDSDNSQENGACYS
jgi:hypothetical protein